MKRPRIPIWLPLAATLAITVGLAAEAYPELIKTLDASTIGRKYPDIRLLRKVFTSPVPLEIEDEYIQRRVIRDAISGLHRQTYARVGRLTDGKYRKIVDNIDDIKGTVPEAVVTEGLRLVDTTQIYESAQGVQFRLAGVHYHAIATRFPLTRAESQGDGPYSGRIILITNLDKATQKAREILITLSVRILVTISVCASASIWVIVMPLLRIDWLIRREQIPTVQWWAPVQFEKLAMRLRLDQAANIQYKRKAEESAAIANSTINGITDAIIFLKDAEGVYLLCNEAFTPIAGRDPIGLTDDDLAWSAEQTAKYRAEDAAVIATGEQLSVVEQIGGRTDSHWYITRKVRVSIEGEPAMLGISLDVDELVSARETAENLAEEIQTVNHIAVHDIKADLTALNLGNELIQETIAELTDYLTGKSDEVIDEAIDTIKHFSGLNIKSARNAFEVLDQRNKLYNLESKIEIASCSVTDLLDSLSAAFSPEPGEMRIYNECPETRQILADKSLLMTVLKNIVRNGFVHNESPLKRVEVKVSPIGHRTRIQIADNGVGMPPSYLENWGTILGKAAQLSNKRGGSGTGLYSIRAIVMAHKGASIEVTSAVGQGTTFTLEFSDVS